MISSLPESYRRPTSSASSHIIIHFTSKMSLDNAMAGLFFASQWSTSRHDPGPTVVAEHTEDMASSTPSPETTTTTTTTTATGDDQSAQPPVPDSSTSQQNGGEYPADQKPAAGPQNPAEIPTGSSHETGAPRGRTTTTLGKKSPRYTSQVRGDDRCVMCRRRCWTALTIPCHLLCSPCMELLVFYRDSCEVLQCPHCYRLYPVTERWREHFLADKLWTRNYENVGRNPFRRCYRCKQRQLSNPPRLAEYFCYQCRQPFCSSCHSALHSAARGRRRHHVVIPLVPDEWTFLDEEGMTYCSQHRSLPLSSFCLPCDSSVCEECWRTTHAGHEVWQFWANLQNAHNVLRGRLSEMLDHKRLVGRLLDCLRSLSEAVRPRQGLASSAGGGGGGGEGRRTSKRQPECLKWTTSQQALGSVQSLNDHPSLTLESPKAQRKPRNKKKRKRAKAEDRIIPKQQSSHEHIDIGVSAAAAAAAAAAASVDNVPLPELDSAWHWLLQEECSSSTAQLSNHTRDAVPYDCTSHLSHIPSESLPSDSGDSGENRRSYSDVVKAGCAHGLDSCDEPPELVSALNSPSLLIGMAETRVKAVESVTTELNAVSSQVESSEELVPCGRQSSEASSVCVLSVHAPPTEVVSSDSLPPCLSVQVDTKSPEKPEGNGLLDDAPSTLGVLPNAVIQCVSADAMWSDSVTVNASLEQLPQPESMASVEPTHLHFESSDGRVWNRMSSRSELLEAGLSRSEASSWGGPSHLAQPAGLSDAALSDNMPSKMTLSNLTSSHVSSKMTEVDPSNSSLPVTTASEAHSANYASSVTEALDMISSLFSISDTTSSDMTSSHSLSSNQISEMTSLSSVSSNAIFEIASSNTASSDADLSGMILSNSAAIDSSSSRNILSNSSSPNPLSSDFKPSQPMSEILKVSEVSNDAAQNVSISKTDTDNSSSTQENTDTFPKSSASSCGSSLSSDCVAHSMTSAQQGASQDKGSSGECHDQQSETSSPGRVNSTDMNQNASDTDGSVVTDDPETGDSFWGDLDSEKTDAASNHIGDSENSKLEDSVRDVFGESLCQHLWAVETVFNILQSRTDILICDLDISRLSCLSSIFTWMRARPAVSDKMYAVLKMLFPDSSSESTNTGCVPSCSHDSTKTTVYYNSNLSDSLPKLNTRHSAHVDGLSRPCELISQIYAEHGQGYSGGAEDRHVAHSNQELRLEYLDSNIEEEPYENDMEFWI